MPELTDLSVIRALCEKYDFALSKGFGQNFIINPGIPTKIVDASGVDKRYGVIEIGPGIGVLTKELAQRAAKVVSIEVDERLPPLLAETMAGVDNFKLVLQDVLKVDLKALIAQEFPGMPVAVCANLPYYITSPIVMKLLGDRLPIQNLTVMVQKEAADRLAAAPGTRASSAISCAVSYYATSELMFTAAPGSFYPAPKVTSAVVRMDIRPAPAVQVEDEDGYFALTKPGYIALVILMLIIMFLTAFIVDKKQNAKKFQAKQLAFAGIALALAFITSYIKYELPMGGSLTLFSMFFICYIGYLYGTVSYTHLTLPTILRV